MNTDTAILYIFFFIWPLLFNPPTLMDICQLQPTQRWMYYQRQLLPMIMVQIKDSWKLIHDSYHLQCLQVKYFW